MELRLTKWLSQQGICSRRTAEAWLGSGRIALNGAIVTQPGTKIDPERDQVMVDGRMVGRETPTRRVLLLWKPVGYVTTLRDPAGRPTVAELIPSSYGRLYPVGRLDLNSEGALLLTNDGELANRFTHPRYHLPKTYQVEVVGVVRAVELERLRNGLVLEDGPTQPAEACLLGPPQETSRLEVTLYEGRKRQLRRMLAALGHPVLSLRRVRFGSLSLEGLRPGEYRELGAVEVTSLAEEAGGREI